MVRYICVIFYGTMLLNTAAEKKGEIPLTRLHLCVSIFYNKFYKK